MKKRWMFGTMAALLATVAAGFGFAQNRPATTTQGPSRPADEKAVREAAQAFARAFEKGDSRALGVLFTSEAEYVDEDGEPVRGRAALAKAYSDFFAKRKDVKTAATTEKVRFLGKDTAVEEGTFIVRAANEPPNASRYSTLFVREDGRWLIAMLKEWGDETTTKANLEDLAWLIGTWEGEGGDLKARTTYEWGDNKANIRGRYTLEPKAGGKPVASGTQIITVDPVSGLLHGWTFDSERGTGEAIWSWDGDRWVIDSVGEMADGSETTATNFLTRVGDNAFTWRSVERTLDGESLPDLPLVKVNRLAAGR